MFYTYLIGWTEYSKWYYGVRNSKKVDAVDDLWVGYFTSSKYVKEFALKNGPPDVIEVRKIHSSWDDAMEWECKVLRRCAVAFNDKWLNKTDNKCIDRRGMRHSDATKEKMRQARHGKTPMLGKRHSEETKAKMRDKRIAILESNPELKFVKRNPGGYHKRKDLLQRLNSDPEKIRKTAEANRGKKRTPEQCERIRQGALNRKKTMKNGE